MCLFTSSCGGGNQLSDWSIWKEKVSLCVTRPFLFSQRWAAHRKCSFYSAPPGCKSTGTDLPVHHLPLGAACDIVGFWILNVLRRASRLQSSCQVSSQENKTSSCNQLQSCHTFTMFPLSRNVLSSLKIRSIQQIRARQSHAKHSPDFHDKYGNTLLTRGTIFCVVAWVFTITQIGIEWNQSPVGRVTPKEWNDE